jgi:DNA-binding phage protein
MKQMVEEAGTEGTLWMNIFLRRGFGMFSMGKGGEDVAEKADVNRGWLFRSGMKHTSGAIPTCSRICSTASIRDGHQRKLYMTGMWSMPYLTRPTVRPVPSTGRQWDYLFGGELKLLMRSGLHFFL